MTTNVLMRATFRSDCRLAPLALVLAVLTTTAAQADRPEASTSRVFPRRCDAAKGDGRPCADLAESVDKWLGGDSGDSGGMAIAMVLETESLIANTTMAQSLLVNVGGTGRWLTWHVGAGLLQAYDAPAYGFIFSGNITVRVAPYSPWGIQVGAKFLNQTSVWDESASRPEQHILGELGGAYDVPMSDRWFFRVRLSALIGVERRWVARFDSAREVVDQLNEVSGGGELSLGFWFQ